MAALKRHDACNGSVECFSNGCTICEVNILKNLHELQKDDLLRVFSIIVDSRVKKIFHHGVELKEEKPVIRCDFCIDGSDKMCMCQSGKCDHCGYFGFSQCDCMY
jgi:hypothetical protein